MSIQSTIFITRENAESQLREKRAREVDISKLSDNEIENELEEKFYNYLIVEKNHPSLNQ